MPSNPLIIPDGYGLAHFQFQQDLSGGNMSISIAYKFSPAASNATLNAQNIYTTITGGGCPFEASNMQDAFVVRGVTTLERYAGSLYPGDYFANLFGTKTGEPNPAQVTALVRRRTAIAGRQYRGRIYMPLSFCNETQVDRYGTIDSSVVTAQQTRWDTWRDLMATADLPLVLLHSVPKAGGAAPLPTGIVSLQLESKVATQRRRYRR